MTNETVGERIKRLRKEKRINASDFAKKIGVSRANVYRYENGEINKMPYKVLEPIANVLGTTPAYLLSGKEDNNYEELSKRMKVRFGNVKLNENEIEDILSYADFVLSKRRWLLDGANNENKEVSK